MKLQPYHFITPPKPDNEAELKDWEAKFGAEPPWPAYQVRYPGFKHIMSANFELFRKETNIGFLRIALPKEGHRRGSLLHKPILGGPSEYFSVYLSTCLSTEMFELFCKENNIEL